MQIKLTSIYVDSHDKALKFYVDVLGLQKKADFGNNGYRWLTVNSPEDPNGPELQLELNANPAAKAYQEAMFTQGQPALLLHTKDVKADYERVKAKAVVGPGTTRHLEMVKWIIDNNIASEPDMPLWAGFSNNEIPVNLGKLLTGQDFGGDAKKCMDTIAGLIDAQVADAGLL